MEGDRLIAVIREINPGSIYLTSFTNAEELSAEIAKENGKIELVQCSTDYKAMKKVFDQDDAPPSPIERIVKLSTNSHGELNQKSLLWFFKKII